MTRPYLRAIIAETNARMVLNTSIGDDTGNWRKAFAPEQLRQAIRDNLANLGLVALDIVNPRV
jgi:aryl-alcohol dehydrogenase-like predicted oxidoreductase